MLQDYKSLISINISILVALAARWFYHTRWAGLDFWGDAYHHWLISRLTLESGWIYTDYKGLETIWLPGYHYLISIVMFVWGRFDLLPAHLTNIILGTIACGLVAWLVSESTSNWISGLAAGVTLALMPWHIAYSRINMPEVMAGVLLLGLLIASYKDWIFVLPVIGFLGTLTRHELTLSIVIIGIWLWYKRGQSAVRTLWLGSGFGLLVWSSWSWYQTGNPLSWWTQSLGAAAHDAKFNNTVGTRLADIGTLVDAANQAYPLLGLLCLTAIAVLVGVCAFQWHYELSGFTWLLIAIVGIHWFLLGRSLVNGFLPVADPRFVLITVPVLTGVGIIAIATIPQRFVRYSLTALQILMLCLSLPRQVPEFSKTAYVTHPEKAAGEYLGELATIEPNDNFWVDAPTAIYHSNLELDRFFSSDTLLPKMIRSKEGISDAALEMIKEKSIRYVLWEDVSYTFVGEVWPQMAEAAAFDQHGYHFEPIFHYSGWELEYGAAPAILWQIHYPTVDRSSH